MGERPKADFNLDSLSQFDDSLIERWRNARQEERLTLRNEFQQQLEQQDDEWWKRYNAYLETKHWHILRGRVLTRDPICQVCFENKSTQAHHWSYASFNKWGMSFLCECAGVCQPCHDDLHQGDDEAQ